MADETVVTEDTEETERSEPTPLEDLFSNQQPVATEGEKTTPTAEKPKDAVADEKPIEGQAEVKEPESEIKPDEKPIEAVEKPTGDKVAKLETELTSLRQRHEEAAKWANRVSSENGQLRKQLEMINKKLDGTWTEEDEKAAQQPEVTIDDVVGHTALRTKMDISRTVAYDKFGKDVVEQTLFAEDAEFPKLLDDPIVRLKVFSSDMPVVEAMEIVEIKRFYDKWGYKPKDIETNMRKAVETELREKLTQEIMKKLQGKTPASAGLRDVSSSDVREEVRTFTPLEQIFG